MPVYPRFRGRHKLHRFEDTGLEKCVGCSLCAAACPADCIRVVAAENTPENRVSAGERYAAVYEINLSRCIFCGYCEVACPFDAITMGHDFEMSDYNRSDLIFTKEMLLAEPLERTPLRPGGRVASRLAAGRCSSSRRSARSPARSAWSRCANPFYTVLVARRAPALAGRAVPAAARRVRRRRAGRRLRRRGDGALRVRRRLRRRGRRAVGSEQGRVGSTLRVASHACSARSCSSSCSSRCSAPACTAIDTKGAAFIAGLRHAALRSAACC